MDALRSRWRKVLAKIRKALPWVIAGAALVALLGLGVRNGVQMRSTFVYKDHLKDTAVTIDGEELTFRDLAFYVVYEEWQVQKSAYAYDQQKPANYWNSHVNGHFISVEARNMAMDMAVHDHILLRMAQSDGVVLSSDERAELESRRTDFFEDLYDDQMERLPVSYQTLDASMADIAVAEKYRKQLAVSHNDTYASYGYDGKAYLELKKKHEVKVNKKLWSKVPMGRVTLNNEADYQAARGKQNYFREGTDQKK
ncbi:MAG: hypothetical protein II177_06480 [Lachnospiraceae bacterium]|nr:hypothetical protein [Lachnospiraceae bacterium]